MPIQDVSKEQAEANASSTPSYSNDYVNTDLSSIEITEERDMTVYESDFLEITDDAEDISSSRVRKILTDSANGIFGMPYSYPNIVDTITTGRSDNPMDSSNIGEGFGRKFSDKIASVMPILFLCPGNPSYLPSYSEDKQRAVLNAYGSDESDLSGLLEGEDDAPFYTFNSAFDKYADYVNTMVRTLAILMDLGGEKYYDGSYRARLSQFDIRNILNDDFKGLFNASTSIALYLDSDASVSESFSNSTTESMLSSTVNSFSDKGREISFLMGSLDAGTVYDTMTSAVGSVGDIGENIADSVGLGKGILGRLSSSLTTVVSGGKLMFPEIWSGSEYSRNYNISLKLRTPDNDPLSILLNIYLPICALVCMTAPLQAGGSANSYLSPFLVRGTYKSIFNCELGIITGLDIQKGGEDNWNSLGMPTSADITITIKDLYSDMFISNDRRRILNNVAQLDYLCLAAGIDMNKNWITRRKKLEFLSLEGSITGAPKNAWESLKTGANKAVTGFLSNALGADIRWSR